MRVWVAYYSQAGDAAAVARAVSEPFQAAGHEVVIERIRVVEDYPFPWRSLFRFFSVLPESLLGPPPPVYPIALDLRTPLDLVILVYQVWFLSPSLPVQGFLASPSAEVLGGRELLTVSVSRNMWVSGFQRMKRWIRECGAVHLDHISVTHQGPPWATFVTEPRAALSGRRDPFWFFPAAGVGEAALEHVRCLGALACERWSQRLAADRAPLLAGVEAAHIHPRYLLPECVGWYLFMAWAHLLKRLGRPGSAARNVGIVGFIPFLVVAIAVGIPLLWLGALVLRPVVRPAMEAYARKIAAPAGAAMTPSGRSPCD
jgi:hypothetical protein